MDVEVEICHDVCSQFGRSKSNMEQDLEYFWYESYDS